MSRPQRRWIIRACTAIIESGYEPADGLSRAFSNRGAAFRRQVKDDEKTELLIFMTPHVVATPEDLTKIAAKEKEQMEMAPKAFDEKELKRYITKP